MFRSLIKQTAVSVASYLSAALIITGANAAVVIDELPDSPFSGGEIGTIFQPILTPNTPFEEIYSFTTTGLIDVTASAEVIELSSALTVSNFAFSLVENTSVGDDFASFDTLATGVDNGTGGLALTVEGLEVGKLYGLLFGGTTGLAGGVYGGAYTVEVEPVVSNVPIPTALPLFLTAITGLVLIARRKKPAAM